MPHKTRPVIGINADFIAASKVNRPHLRLNVGYFEAVAAAGRIAGGHAPLRQGSGVAAFLEDVDGFVLSGGLDLDPRRQGQPTHASIQPMAERREESDRILVRMLLQEASAAAGRSASACTSSTRPAAAPCSCICPKSSPRPCRTSIRPVRGRIAMPCCCNRHAHGRVLRRRRNPGQQPAPPGRQAGRRRPAHRRPGPRRRHRGHRDRSIPNWFCIGVQWHPESETASALDMQLFEGFMQACIAPAA